jgi:hypothetical protein
MSIFAQFPPNTPSLLTALQVTEQVAQLLFGTMNQDLFIDDGHDETSAAKWFADKVAARTLTYIPPAVFAKTSWKPPMGIQGCNWLSALTEAQPRMSLWLYPDVLVMEGIPCGFSQRVEEVSQFISHAICTETRCHPESTLSSTYFLNVPGLLIY